MEQKRIPIRSGATVLFCLGMVAAMVSTGCGSSDASAPAAPPQTNVTVSAPAATPATVPMKDAGDPKALEPLPLRLPAPTLKGTPDPDSMPRGPHIEPFSDKPRPAFLAPRGVKNVAQGKPVTSSVAPYTGELAQITDGEKEAFDDETVEFKKGTQWVQVDLGEPYAIYAIVLWHDHRYFQLFHDVIVQVSDDPEFKSGVTTLYNNDTDNSSGLGVGNDKEYFETKEGRIIDGKGAKARYVRSYTHGSSQSAINAHEEIEVYALPGK